jgi:hypothetical protein
MPTFFSLLLSAVICDVLYLDERLVSRNSFRNPQTVEAKKHRLHAMLGFNETKIGHFNLSVPT